MKILNNLHAFLWRDTTSNNCNSFFIDGEKKILIDPGHYHLLGHIREGLSRLSYTTHDIDLVIITHAHPDHMEGAKEFAQGSTLIAAPKVDMEFMKSIPGHLRSALGVSDFEPDFLLQEGDLTVGNIHFQTLHSPGHSPGSICLYWPETKVLIAGDVVFDQGLGRTDLPGGNGEELKKSIRRLSHLDVEYLLTGHGEIISGRENIIRNFKGIEDFWFAYI